MSSDRKCNNYSHDLGSLLGVIIIKRLIVCLLNDDFITLKLQMQFKFSAKILKFMSKEISTKLT